MKQLECILEFGLDAPLRQAHKTFVPLRGCPGRKVEEADNSDATHEESHDLEGFEIKEPPIPRAVDGVP